MIKTAGYRIPKKTLVAAARGEPVDDSRIASGVEDGTIVVLENTRRRGLVRPVAVGTGLRTKVNANFGTSRDVGSLEEERRKMQAALEAGTDTVMDLSTGEDREGMLRMVLEQCPQPVGTVPIYGLACRVVAEGMPLKSLDAGAFIEAVSAHCELGVDFITVHCGVTLEAVRHLDEQGRVAGIVSRGGSFLYRWMRATGCENPLYTHYDEILKVAARYNVTLSLGDGLRPGAIADATDRPQTCELIVLGELVDRARAAGVQAMVEGPGHVPLNQVEMNIRMEKEICKGAPFYVLGPLVTDIAPGYDHITSAIGGAVAGAAGADFLCYVTPAEHLRLPTAQDVHTGVIATRIAAHAADIAKGLPGAAEWDRRMSAARKKLDWDKMLSLAIDSPLACKIRQSSQPLDKKYCTMCSELCALK
ncbi:MAG: phosphomethylpyrimidine synthase ThiC [Candidatus Glassbacteria bacterium]|nr:phosphomethylpyrimidine synthase ThiC [Candidatus Glassbacteria bacterium]